MVELMRYRQFEAALAHIFHKYSKPTSNSSSSPPPPAGGSTGSKLRLTSPITVGGVLTEAGLDAWAKDTTGVPFSADTKEELRTLDVNERGELTYEFLSLSFIGLFKLCPQVSGFRADLSTAGRKR